MNSTSIPNYFYAIVLFLLTICFAVINFNVPIIGDVWAPRIFGQEYSGSFLSIKGYIRGYFGGNPRIGQFWLIFSGYHPNLYAVVASIFATTFILLLGVMVEGNKILTRKWTVLSSAIIAFAILWFIDREVGPIFFYQATNSNYLFAAIITIAFLVPYRNYIFHGNEVKALEKPLFIFGFSLLSVFAGMAHETFGPSIIGILILFLLFQFLILKVKPRLWQALSTIAYVIGYGLVFLAPGQDKRYTESRYDGIPKDLDSILTKGSELLNTFVGDGLIIALLALVILLVRLRDWKKYNKYLIAILLLCAISTGVMLTAIAAPILGHRLAFLSHSLMAIAFTIIFVKFIEHKVWRGILTVLAIGYLAIEYGNTRSAYQDYKRQFDAQAEAVKAGIAANDLNITAPAYDIYFDEQKKYIYPEFPQKGNASRVNAFIARYYKVKTFKVGPPKAVVIVGERFLGEGAIVRLDGDCPESDSTGWLDKQDPMGSLVCHKDYKIKYDTVKGAWIVAGPREVPGENFRLMDVSYETVGKPPSSGELRIWGGIYSFNSRGYIFSSRGKWVGRIVSDESP